jgi:hypothetical protein
MGKIMAVDYLLKSKARPNGIVEFRIMRSGLVVREFRDHNLVVDSAFFQMARLLAGDVTGRSITQIGFGTGDDAPAPTDTALTDQYLRAVSGYEYPGNSQVRINWILPTTECNGMEIREFGLFTADDSMFSRFTLEEAVPKLAAFSIEGSWTILLAGEEENV